MHANAQHKENHQTLCNTHTSQSMALGAKRQGGVMASRTFYEVFKTTTEKLQSVLNNIGWSDPDRVVQLVKLEHVGGRDWVVVVSATDRLQGRGVNLTGSLTVADTHTTTFNPRAQA